MVSETFLDLGLNQFDHLSARSLTVCQIAGIKTIGELIHYHEENYTFKNISNCGRKTEEELIEFVNYLKLNKNSLVNKLCEFTDLIKLNNLDEKLSKVNLKELEVIQLLNFSEISKRSLNVCHSLEIFTAKDLIHYYFEFGTFTNLSNIGRKSEIELKNFSEKLISSFKKVNIEIPSFDIKLEFVEKLIEFPKIQYPQLIVDLFSNIIKYKSNLLSARAKKFIDSYFDTENINSFIYNVVLNNFDFKYLENIGLSTEIELKIFKSEFESIFKSILDLSDSDLKIEYLISIINLKFKAGENLNDELRLIFTNYQGSLFFRLINFLLEKGIILNEIQLEIFQSNWQYVNNMRYQSFDEIAEKYKLTRERVRQIRVDIPHTLTDKLLFLRFMNCTYESIYKIDFNNEFVFFDPELAEKVNMDECVSFSQGFYTLVTAIISHNKYVVFGNDYKIKTKVNRQKQLALKYSYLISKNIFEIFRFQEFFEDICQRILEKRTDTYKLPFTGHLLNFFEVNNPYKIEIIADICEKVLNIEFEIYINYERYLIFERTSKKYLSEYIVEVLEKKGRLMHLNEILEEIIEIKLEQTINIDTLRSSMIDRELFIFVGRSSTYGLKIWENEYDDFKGGTIRDLAREYLCCFEEPKHISEVTLYVNKFRNTNERNVLSNLKLDESKRFIAYEGGFFGLSEKHYKDTTFKTLAGAWFSKGSLKIYHNRNIDEVINDLINRYKGVKESQIKNVLNQQIISGKICLTDENMLLIQDTDK